ncbi:MAG: glycosyltransferase [Candidatus Chisholmbacteria bacterium]|nr:glycosyltransferase [Candidatus Chisholmbacteria bacterium]
MNPNPYFSIIIPTLNEQDYLPKLLNDLSHQTLDNFEVIIVDAKSKDNTLKVAEKFQDQLPQLTILVSPKRHVSYQRNLGSKKAHAPVLVFIDADSRLPRFFLEGLKYDLTKTPADLFVTWLKADSTNSQDAALATIANLAYETLRILDAPTGVGAMLGFKKSVFQKLGGFDETISYSEDQELIRRAVARKYNFVIYKDPRYTYSFRRFRQEGKLKFLRKFARLQTNILTHGYHTNSEKDYPMGGHVFKGPSKETTLTGILKRLLRSPAKTPKE